MGYVTLVQLLYLADRKALMIWGHPITTASYIATGDGVGFSNCISIFELKGQGRDVQMVELSEEFVWEAALSGLKEDEGFEAWKLSEGEMLIIEMFVEYGSLSSQALSSIVWDLPEMRKKGPISYRDILQAAQKPRGRHCSH